MAGLTLTNDSLERKASRCINFLNSFFSSSLKSILLGETVNSEYRKPSINEHPVLLRTIPYPRLLGFYPDFLSIPGRLSTGDS